MITPSPDLLTFLRLCLQSRWHPPALIEAETLTRGPDWDWEAATTAAMQGRVAPLLYDTLKGAAWVPGNVLQQLHRAYLFTAARAIALQRDLAELLNVLTEAGIPHIVLKGAVLGETVYENIALRPLGDLDLLVRDGDAVAAQRAAQEIGYVHAKAPMRGKDKEDISTKEVHLFKSNSPSSTNVDLHWHLFSPPVSVEPWTPAWIWDSAVQTTIEPAHTLTLGTEAQIIYLASHVGEQHAEGAALGTLGTLLWLTDIGALIARDADTIDWPEMLTRAETYDLTAPTRTVLEHLIQDWMIPVPDLWRVEISRLRVTAFKQRALELMTTETPYGLPAHRTFFLRLANLKSWRARASLLLSYILPSADHLQQRYRISRPFYLPAFYIIHWFHGLRGLALTLWIFTRARAGSR